MPAFVYVCVCDAKFSLMTNIAQCCRGLVDRLFVFRRDASGKLNVADHNAEGYSGLSHLHLEIQACIFTEGLHALKLIKICMYSILLTPKAPEFMYSIFPSRQRNAADVFLMDDGNM